MFNNDQIKKFLDMEYMQLKEYLLNANLETKRELLMNKDLKIKLINSPKRHDFIWLAQEMDNDLIPLLLSDEGINILSETSELCDKLNGIITSGNLYVNELLKMDGFNKLIVENLEYLKPLLSTISGGGAINLMKYMDKVSTVNEKKVILFNGLSSSAQEAVVKNIKIPNEILIKILRSSAPVAAHELLEKNINNLDLSKFSLTEIYNLATKEVNIPKELFDNKAFIKNLSTLYDVKEYRMIINAFQENNDITLIENKRKEYYNNQLLNFNNNENMLNEFYLCYNDLLNLYNNNEISNDEIINIIDKYINMFDDSGFKFKFNHDVINYFYDNDMNGLKDYFQKESKLQLTNMVIDYHFQDVYFNVLIDIRELLEFEQNGGNTLSSADIELYQNILNLDNMNYVDILNLHNQLKSNDMVNKFYDDIRKAKNKSYNMIKDKMLTESKLSKFKNEALSKEAGVNIYVLDGEPFYAFIKSLTERKDHVIKELHSYVDAASYSLDGSDKLATYLDSQEYYNILYGDFNVDQVIHLFPVDSYSRYIRGYNDSSTDRVNKIATPHKFVTESPNYSEIVMMQKNETKNEELNNNMKNPVPIAIYCYDKITPNDIESAKALGIGIVVVNTRKYTPHRSSNQIHLMDTTSTGNEPLNNNYLTSINDDAMYGRR